MMDCFPLDAIDEIWWRGSKRATPKGMGDGGNLGIITALSKKRKMKLQSVGSALGPTPRELMEWALMVWLQAV
jgi:hypothetical protein